MKKEIFKKILIFGIFIFLIYFSLKVIGSDYDTPHSESGLTKVHFFNVGQGDAALVEIDDNTQLLIDSGPDKSILNELGRAMPYYDRKIEYVIVSHAHADHFMGLIYVLERYQIETIFMSSYGNTSKDFEYLLEKIKENNISLKVVSRGKVIKFGEWEATVLWPQKGDYQDLNDTSIVINFKNAAASILFSGDVSHEILEKITELGDSYDIYKVSHHGSITGTSLKTVENIKPTYSVISAGEKNRFRHPHKSVLSLLKGSTILQTSIFGTITFYINEAGIFL